jgi:hypothetical protein
MTTSGGFWRRCSSCKREIRFETPYWTCSVSTCNRKGSSFVFCSIACWNAHVPTMRHRDAWAEERSSPTEEEWSSPGSEASGSAGGHPSSAEPGEIPHDILIVVSKLKQYVRARSGMNTSDSVMEVLSRRIRAMCDDAIQRARDDGRKTIMDRDF